jgi:hypothetical protein
MGNESLKIIVGADISGATAQFNTLGATVSKVGADLGKSFSVAAASVTSLNTPVAAVASSLTGLGSTTKALDTAFQKAFANIDAAIENTAADASELKTKLIDLGTARIPLDSILKLQAAVANLKADLKSGLTGNISIAIPTLNLRAPINSLDQLRAAVKRTQIDLMNGLVPALSAVPPAANKVGVGLRNVVPGANQAANALTNVGRVAQDLPFGFLGIQNNLNPLLESFQRLKAETGSSGAALKALGSSLIGPAGLGIALSVISGAILIYQNGIQGFNKKTKEAADKSKEFVDSLKSVNDIIGEATGGQQGQIAQVQALADVVTNTNAAYDDRKRALQELGQINKNYFGDLKLEEGQLGLLTARVDEYTKAIVAQAVVKGFTDEISRVAIELNKQEKALNSSRDALERRRKVLEKTVKPSTGGTREEAGAVASLTRNYNSAVDAVREAEGSFKDQRETVEKLRFNYVELGNSIQQATIESLKFRDTNSPEKEKAAVDALKKRLDALEKIKDSLKDFSQIANIEEQIFDLKVKITLRDAAKNGLSKEETDLAIKGFRDQLSEAFENETKSLEAIVKVKPQFVLRDETKPLDTLTDLAKSFKKIPEITIKDVRIRLLGFKVAGDIEAAEKRLKEFAANIQATLQTAASDAFVAIGESIGEGIAEGGIGGILVKFGSGLLKIVGQVLQDIGKQMILASKLVIALKKVLSSVGLGVGSLILGVALVAAGGLLKNIKFNTPQFEKGGVATGPRSGYLATLHGTELIIPMNKIDKRPNTGGIQGAASSSPIILQPSVAIQGQALRILLNRVDRSNDRLF